jgi:phospholipid transport system substrate-binding protein
MSGSVGRIVLPLGIKALGLRAALIKDADRAREDQAVVTRLVEEYVVPSVDMPLSSQLILGRHWRSADEAQRAAFVEGYRQLLLRTYSTHAMDYMDAKVDYLSAAPLGADDARFTVRTRVERLGKRPAQVDYRVGVQDGQWKVFDAVVNGVSLVSTLRTAVDAEVSRIGLPALITQLSSGKMVATPQVATQ